VLTATAGTASGNCTIDIEKAESNDYRATTYRVSLSVFDLPSTPGIQTPVLTDTTNADGVQVQIPWTLPNTGSFVAPITGYEVQTKTGSNWQVADGGSVAGAATTMATIAVTPWTSIYVRVAALSDYATANSRSWSTFGGATAQAFTVPGLVTRLSVDSISAAAIDAVTVTGVGFDATLTPTVLLEAPQAIFNVAGVMQKTIQVQAAVANSTSLSFRLPGEKLPAGMDTIDVTAKVVATNNMESTPGTFTITSGDESVDIGLDPVTGRMTPKINTIFEGTYTLSYSSTTNQKIFTSYVCAKTVKVKGKAVCKSYNWVDSAVCKVSQVLPSNPSKARRLITFKTYCQLTPAAKASLTTTNAPSLTRVATFVRLYPKTHLPYVLVKGKKTLVLKVSTSTKVIKLHG
jgi:hypothetical protein